MPIYYRLKVYTAYEYLETRFDRKTRQLAALLFLLSRGLGAGISHLRAGDRALDGARLAAPADQLVPSARSSSSTPSRRHARGQPDPDLQMVVMLGGMAAAFGCHRCTGCPRGVARRRARASPARSASMKVIDFSPRLDTRYTFWSGMTGGLFVQLAYFGTDQSQVQRYLTGSPLAESRLGLHVQRPGQDADAVRASCSSA